MEAMEPIDMSSHRRKMDGYLEGARAGTRRLHGRAALVLLVMANPALLHQGGRLLVFHHPSSSSVSLNSQSSLVLVHS
jgi:hypothetical protein